MSEAEFNGRTFELLWVGKTKFGERAHLQTFDGKRDFWVAASKVKQMTNKRNRDRKFCTFCMHDAWECEDNNCSCRSCGGDMKPKKASNEIDPEIEKLYYEALAADEAFAKAVEKQFPEQWTGNMRYRYNLFNAETMAAANLKEEADERLREAVRAHREKEGVGPKKGAKNPHFVHPTIYERDLKREIAGMWKDLNFDAEELDEYLRAHNLNATGALSVSDALDRLHTSELRELKNLIRHDFANYSWSAKKALASQAQKDKILRQLHRLHIGDDFSGGEGIPVIERASSLWKDVETWLQAMSGEESQKIWGELADTPYVPPTASDSKSASNESLLNSLYQRLKFLRWSPDKEGNNLVLYSRDKYFTDREMMRLRDIGCRDADIGTSSAVLRSDRFEHAAHVLGLDAPIYEKTSSGVPDTSIFSNIADSLKSRGCRVSKGE